MGALYNLAAAWYRPDMRRLRAHTFSSLFLSSSFLWLASCTGGTSHSATTATVDLPADIGEASIHASDKRRHVELLASDAFEGRNTLKPGYDKAAAYIANEFSRYGLAPMPGQKSLVVPYSLWSYGYEPGETSLRITTAGGEESVALGKDAAPFRFSDDGALDNDIVFAGYGITAKEAHYDDYEGLDVKGKWVLIFRHAPGHLDPASPFFAGERKGQSGLPDLSGYSNFTRKALNAQDHGAKGMLLVSGPVTSKEPDDLRMPLDLMVPRTPAETAVREAAIKKMREAREAAMAKRAGKSRGGNAKAENKTLLAFHISSEIATALVASTGKSLEALQLQLDAGTKASAIHLQVRAQAKVKTRKEPTTVSGKNVIGYLEGSDPALKSQFVVVGAHFDHLGILPIDPSKGQDIVYNGADDNASGTSGMLELAEAFASANVAPRRSMLFMAFSGEEEGLRGSRALVKQGDLDTSRVAFMLNLDMIGRNSNDPVEFVGADYATNIRDITEAINKDMSVPLKFGPYAADSDHHAFFEKEVPVAFFFTGLHADYHRLSDHADKIDFRRMEKIVTLGFALTREVANAERRPTFIYKLGWLGTSLQRGVVSAIEKDSRGEAAGLMTGDIVAKIGEVEIRDGIALALEQGSAGHVLSQVEQGTNVAIQLVRHGKAVAVTLERAKRGYLGIAPGRLSDEARAKLGLIASEGVFIGHVLKDTPAQKSGLKDGDIITKLSGHAVNGSTLGSRLAQIGAGETITVQVVRDGKRTEMPLTLGERPTR